MPAPLAKGPPTSSARHPNHPLATGLIIAASVLVAAGIAIYESPQVRQWVDQSRRKIAVAINSFGEDGQPRRPHESSDAHDDRRRREELMRRNRNECIRKAREEGIAVDLDELATIGSESIELAERRSRSGRTKSTNSFDDLVGSDGMLRATGKDSSNNGLKQRGAAGFAAGAAAAAAMSNPFSDDNVLFDVGDGEDEAPTPQAFNYVENRTNASSMTIKPEPSSPVTLASDTPNPATAQNDTVSPTAPLIDLAPDSHPAPQQPVPAPYTDVADDADAAAQSFYSFTSSTSQENLAQTQFFDNEDAEHVSTGTLTPRSQRSNTNMSTGHASIIDLSDLGMQSDVEHDARSEAFSEADWTDADVSEAGDRTGIMTPNSWTDVGSDDESEWGGAAQNGHVSQVYPQGHS